MLTVYSVSWCPHCKKTVRFLTDNHIDFIYKDVEKQPGHIVRQVIDANGGHDWVVPTLEYNGQWRPGKRFDEDELKTDLKNWGIQI
ncbi:glutaredoxin family protein [bacterium]|nr:glutaredoxin family protein [bacterium]